MTPERHRKVGDTIQVYGVASERRYSMPSVSQRILREAKYWQMALSGESERKDRIAPLVGVYLYPNGDNFGVPSLVSTWRSDGNLLQYVNQRITPEDNERRRLVRKDFASHVVLFNYDFRPWRL